MGIYLGGNKYHLNLSGSQVSHLNYRIPKEYQEVEWIQAGHAVQAHIDLGFTFDTKCKVELSHWRLTEMGQVQSYLFGGAENNGTLRCMISSPYNGGVDAFCYGSTGSDYLTQSVPLINDSKNELILYLEKGKIRIENITNSSYDELGNQGTYTMSDNLYLLGQNYNGTPRHGGIRRVGYFKYYDKNDNLICDLVPCYRLSDGEIGMYDRARKIFLTNAGSGTFIKGRAVNIDYVNWAQCSINEDGSIYNDGLGYKVGYRVRSGGTEAVDDGAVCTGYIPLKKGDTLRIYPPFSGKNNQNAIGFVNESFEQIGQYTDYGSLYGICTADYRATVINGVTTLTLTEKHDSSIAYVRITHHYDDTLVGKILIITINQEI